jgi:DNA-binding transcriptional LysR family regulator
MVRESAPGVTLELMAPRGQFPWHELGAGGVDLVIGGARLPEVPSMLHRRWIFRDHAVCIVRAGHPQAEGAMSLQRYLELDHIEALPIGAVGMADEALGAQGHKRRIVLVVPHFLIAPFLVAQSNCCFTLANRIAQPLKALLPLAVRPLPYEMPTVTIGAFWHDRVQHDPAHRWLRRVLIEACANVERGARAGGPKRRAKGGRKPKA